MTQPEAERSAIAAMGRILGPGILADVYALYAGEQERLAAGSMPIADQAYGAHPRQMLDLYVPEGDGPRPILLWVHGGGFVRGEKSAPDHPFNAHAGRWAAHNGMIGAVMNYRLAPDATWPSGGEDVAAAVAWLRAHAPAHGGDPDRILLVGTSAGSTHVATFLQQQAEPAGVCGAVLLSGLYGFTALEERDRLYFGAQADEALLRLREAMTETRVPLLLACSEFDPVRFQAETLGLINARFEKHGMLAPALIVSGHNHFSLAYHLGTEDTRLADEILAFLRDRCRAS